MCKGIIGLRSVCCKIWIAYSFIWRWWQYYFLVCLVQNKLIFKVRDHMWLFWHKLISWFFYFLLVFFLCVVFDSVCFISCKDDILKIFFKISFMFKRCISLHCHCGMSNSGVFQSSIHLELKPEAIAPWERTFIFGTRHCTNRSSF